MVKIKVDDFTRHLDISGTGKREEKEGRTAKTFPPGPAAATINNRQRRLESLKKETR